LESLALYFSLLFCENIISIHVILTFVIKIIVSLCNGFFLKIVYVGETQIRK
jgi:hypothetical protein